MFFRNVMAPQVTRPTAPPVPGEIVAPLENDWL